MAMQKRTWSLNALAVELNTDRRTLAKRLDGLPPAETKIAGNRIENRWHLSDVMEWLNTPRARDFTPAQKKFFADAEKKLNEVIVGMIFPGIVSNRFFEGLILNGGMEDVGLTREQAEEMLCFAVTGICYAIEEMVQTPGIEFSFPDSTLEIMKRVGDRKKAA